MGITKDDAERIKRKLNGIESPGGRHRQVSVYYNDNLVARFGIRHGSRRDAGHGHIPKQLYLSVNDTKSLANCHISSDEYFEILQEKSQL